MVHLFFLEKNLHVFLVHFDEVYSNIKIKKLNRKFEVIRCEQKLETVVSKKQKFSQITTDWNQNKKSKSRSLI